MEYVNPPIYLLFMFHDSALEVFLHIHIIQLYIYLFTYLSLDHKSLSSNLKSLTKTLLRPKTHKILFQFWTTCKLLTVLTNPALLIKKNYAIYRQKGCHQRISKCLGHIKNIHLHRCKHKNVKLKLTLTLTLTLTDTGGAVLTLMLGYRRPRNYKLKRKIQIWDCGNMRGVYS